MRSRKQQGVEIWGWERRREQVGDLMPSESQWEKEAFLTVSQLDGLFMRWWMSRSARAAAVWQLRRTFCDVCCDSLVFVCQSCVLVEVSSERLHHVASCSCCWIEAESACRAHRLTAYISTLYTAYYSPNMALILTLGEISLPKVGFLQLKMSCCDAVMLQHVNISSVWSRLSCRLILSHIC